MAIAKSEPKYTFISTGDKTAMYTLRVMCLDTVVMFGESHKVLNHYYIQNLSTDKETAEAKAVEMSEAMGLPFKGNADFDLKEIRRTRDAEAKEKREAIEAARVQREKEWAEEREQLESDGVMLIGKYAGQTAAEIAKVDPGYLFWLADQIESGWKMGICAKIAAKYIAETGLEKPGFVGEVGENLTITLTLNRSGWTSGRFPTIRFVCSDDMGRQIVFFSTAEKFKALRNGDQFTITGLVKEHSEWCDQKQTIINRPKLAK